MTTHATPLPESERLYNARLAVPHYPRIFEGWARASAAVRDSAPCRLDMAYGPHPIERLDLFLPAGRPRGTLMYIHGGYRRSLGKSDASHVAPAFTAAGYAVAVVDYALCPAVDVETIVAQVRRAARWLAARHAEWEAPAGRLFACGHSAGGHLAAMLLATERCVAAAVCVSALYDLRPLLQVPSVMEATRFTSLNVPALSPRPAPTAHCSAAAHRAWQRRKPRLSCAVRRHPRQLASCACGPRRLSWPRPLHHPRGADAARRCHRRGRAAPDAVVRAMNAMATSIPTPIPPAAS
ncbi:alpha/beta hydrolase [Variovorax sp. DAIF25]|jgi:acetyl esterase/lipase|uniref:alpha/beta hydrolase n=1 Tax=unclassified Variovorax TaxID=663243 RepID=UPI003D6B284F